MTKKHYEAIAHVMYQWRDTIHVKHHYGIVRDLVDVMEKDNPKFNRDMFIKACNAHKS